ncbi:MAG: sigma-70 family RNA polymerase sigma factor [Prolixibacteraceae bacterium]
MTVLKSDIEAKLLHSLKSGDHTAFERLFEKYARKLFIFSFAYLKNEADSEEVVQEVFLKVWLNRIALKTDTSFQSYLFTIAFNAIRKSFNRKAKNDQYRLDLINRLDQGQDHIDFENNYLLVTSRLDQFIEEMPQKRKAIFIQRKKQGKPVRQIAAEMEISVKTVENQITEAMKYLRQRFHEELPGGMALFVLFSDAENID